MDDAEIARLRELAQAATPGPWNALRPYRIGVYSARGLLVACTQRAMAQAEDDAAYIAALSPDAVLALLADRDEWKATACRAMSEAGEISGALGGDAYWMDPPDGGSVSLAEQVARANDAGRQADRLGRALALIRDIATGSTTANSLPNIARIANAALLATEGA